MAAKPTPTQRAALILARDGRLRRSHLRGTSGRVFDKTTHTTVHKATYRALRGNGWVTLESADMTGWPVVLTDAGRAALEG